MSRKGKKKGKSRIGGTKKKFLTFERKNQKGKELSEEGTGGHTRVRLVLERKRGTDQRKKELGESHSQWDKVRKVSQRWQ